MSTSAADALVPDSAASATALFTGVKANRGVIGQDATAVKGVSDGVRLTTIAELAETRGRATGVVTNSRITDATPAGVYAHVNDRDDEPVIAQQLLGSGVDVALGGGYRSFISDTAADPWGKKGKRTDAQDLVTLAQSQGYTVVTDASGLETAPSTPGTRVLGLFDTSTLAYQTQARRLRATRPLRDDRDGDRPPRHRSGWFLPDGRGRPDRPGGDRA